jgi:hypothetical protein
MVHRVDRVAVLRHRVVAAHQVVQVLQAKVTQVVIQAAVHTAQETAQAVAAAVRRVVQVLVAVVTAVTEHKTITEQEATSTMAAEAVAGVTSQVQGA